MTAHISHLSSSTGVPTSQDPARKVGSVETKVQAVFETMGSPAQVPTPIQTSEQLNVQLMTPDPLKDLQQAIDIRRNNHFLGLLSGDILHLVATYLPTAVSNRLDELHLQSKESYRAGIVLRARDLGYPGENFIEALQYITKLKLACQKFAHYPRFYTELRHIIWGSNNFLLGLPFEENQLGSIDAKIESEDIFSSLLNLNSNIILNLFYHYSETYQNTNDLNEIGIVFLLFLLKIAKIKNFNKTSFSNYIHDANTISPFAITKFMCMWIVNFPHQTKEILELLDCFIGVDGTKAVECDCLKMFLKSASYLIQSCLLSVSALNEQERKSVLQAFKDFKYSQELIRQYAKESDEELGSPKHVMLEV